MRDLHAMQQIASEMQRTRLEVIAIPSDRGLSYYLGERQLNGQIVADMINDGWLRDHGEKLTIS